MFRDPWAIAIDNDTGYIYVADSGYDNDRPEINEAGKIIRVDPVSGAQELIASGNACNSFPSMRRLSEHDVGRLVPGSSVWHRHRLLDRSRHARRGGHELVQRQRRHHPYPGGSERRANAGVGAGDRVASSTGRAIVSTWMSDGCRRRAQRQHPDDDLHVPAPVDSDCPSSRRDILRMCCAGDLSSGSDEQRSSGREHQRPAVAARSRVCRWRRHSRPCAGTRPSGRDRPESSQGSPRQPGTVPRQARPRTARSCGRTSASAPTG